MTSRQKYFIQYHNADKIGKFPTDNIDFNLSIADIKLKNHIQKQTWIYTRKRTVLNAKNDLCFLIVGKTEKKIKKYFLWAAFIIEDFKYEFKDFIDVIGTGNNLRKPILLNNLDGFLDFKKFCGNFGLGFQNISNNDFAKTLSLLYEENDFSQNIKSKHDEIILKLNKQMEDISFEKRKIEINKILRTDSEIIKEFKKLYNYKCQFPNCNSNIPTRSGNNYVEVAHIFPVHKGGKSIIGNLLVLCPNHHKEFDYGNLKIEIQNVKKLSGILNNNRFEIKFK